MHVIKSLEELNREFQQDYAQGDEMPGVPSQIFSSSADMREAAEPPNLLTYDFSPETPAESFLDENDLQPPVEASERTDSKSDVFTPIDPRQILAEFDFLNDNDDVSDFAPSDRNGRLEPAEGEEEPQKKTHGLSRRFMILFASFAAVLVLMTIMPGLFGYSWHAVVSDSMAREIPEGSLVINKRTAPESIEVGDNITYKRKDGKTVTHKVISVIENCGGSSSRGFVTRGTENVASDVYTVLEEHVVGVVQTHIVGIGEFLLLLKIVFIVILIALPVFGIARFVFKKYRKKANVKENADEDEDEFSQLPENSMVRRCEA